MTYALGKVITLIPACVATATLYAQIAGSSYDPATMDPVERDPANPPQLAEISIGNNDGRMNALMYVAAGDRPRPTVILLNGIPGNERNLDLAQAVRRAGANVLYITYRGTWGNGGYFRVETHLSMSRQHFAS
jgi:uncharacterized protein